MTDVESVYCAVCTECFVKQTTFRLQRVDDDTLDGVMGSRNVLPSCTWSETLELGVLRMRGANGAAAPGGKIGRKINILNEKNV